MPTRKAPVRTKAGKRTTPMLQLSELANVGPATLGNLHQLGIRTVRQLARRDALALYRSLCRRTGKRHDPCVIDVFMAIIHQARGGKAMPWRKFTAERKRVVSGKDRP
jgi:hypothetical protein